MYLRLLTSNDNKAVQFCLQFRLFANASIRISSPIPCDAVVGISIISCRHQMCARNTPATACDHIVAGLCERTIKYKYLNLLTGSIEVSLPEAVEELLRLFEQMTKLQY